MKYYVVSTFMLILVLSQSVPADELFVENEPMDGAEPVLISNLDPVLISTESENNEQPTEILPISAPGDEPLIMPISTNPGEAAGVTVVPGESNCLPPAGAEFYTNMPMLNDTAGNEEMGSENNAFENNGVENNGVDSENKGAETVAVVSMDFPLVATNLDIHIPFAKLQLLGETSDICAYLQYMGTDDNGEHIWKLQKYTAQ